MKGDLLSLEIRWWNYACMSVLQCVCLLTNLLAKTLQPEDSIHPDEEDYSSVDSLYPLLNICFLKFHDIQCLKKFIYLSWTTYSTNPSARNLKVRTTVAIGPTFRCSERAEKRKEVLFLCSDTLTVCLNLQRVLIFIFFLCLVLLKVRRETSSSRSRETRIWS